MKKTLISLAVVGGGIIIALASAIYLAQHKVIYPANFPNSLNKKPAGNPPGYRDPSERNIPYEKIVLTTSDHSKIHGWLMLQSASLAVPTILFLHANAGNRGMRMDYIQQFYTDLNYNVLIIDYRGYGENNETPSEAGIKLDCSAAAEYLKNHERVDPNKLILFGRSLGGAPAIHLASQRNEFRGMILENTFTSIPAVVHHLFPRLGYFIAPLLLSTWRSIGIIHQVACPILFISGRKDSMIPPSHMDALFAAATAARFLEFKAVQDGDHNGTWTSSAADYVQWVGSFVTKALAHP